jgi:hypothetical protein
MKIYFWKTWIFVLIYSHKHLPKWATIFLKWATVWVAVYENLSLSLVRARWVEKDPTATNLLSLVSFDVCITLKGDLSTTRFIKISSSVAMAYHIFCGSFLSDPSYQDTNWRCQGLRRIKRFDPMASKSCQIWWNYIPRLKHKMCYMYTINLDSCIANYCLMMFHDRPK